MDTETQTLLRLQFRTVFHVVFHWTALPTTTACNWQQDNSTGWWTLSYMDNHALHVGDGSFKCFHSTNAVLQGYWGKGQRHISSTRKVALNYLFFKAHQWTVHKPESLVMKRCCQTIFTPQRVAGCRIWSSSLQRQNCFSVMFPRSKNLPLGYRPLGLSGHCLDRWPVSPQIKHFA